MLTCMLLLMLLMLMLMLMLMRRVFLGRRRVVE